MPPTKMTLRLFPLKRCSQLLSSERRQKRNDSILCPLNGCHTGALKGKTRWYDRTSTQCLRRSHQDHPAAMKWREYHESTKHSIESLAQARHGLDWANMPDPFRHYKGVPVLDLPADPPEPEMPALEVLQGGLGTTPVSDGPSFLSQLLFYSAAISATKRTSSSGFRYALRVNPSSGNLHPTEFHS